MGIYSRTPPIWNEARIAEMRALAAAGWTMPQVAKKYGVASGHIAVYARKHGIKFKPGKSGRALISVSDDESALMRSLRLAGKSFKTIGTITGVPMSVVQRHLTKDLGMPAYLTAVPTKKPTPVVVQHAPQMSPGRRPPMAPGAAIDLNAGLKSF